MKNTITTIILCLLLLTGCGINNQQQLQQSINDVNDLLKETEQVISTYSAAADQLNDRVNEEITEVVTSLDLSSPSPVITTAEEYDYVLTFPSNKYPETALHIYGAIEQGHSDVCTIDRDGADDNRKESLRGIDTMEGYDRDEWPMAMCAEGGKGASVAYISASDNRGAGSWVGNELSQYENGEKILFIVEKPTQLFPSQSDDASGQSTTSDDTVIYNSCAEVKAANAAPIKKGDPGYTTKLDRDGDGIGCET